MLTLRPQKAVKYHQNEMLSLGSFHAQNPANSICMQLLRCDTINEKVVVWNQCPFLGRSDLLLWLTRFMIVRECARAVCSCVHIIRSCLHKHSCLNAAVHLCAKAPVYKCVYLYARLCASTLHNADKQWGLIARTHTVISCIVFYSSQIYAPQHFFPWYSSYQHRAYRSIRRAKWRWYLLYLFMKLLSRRRTQGSDCNGWMLTRAKRMKMLSVQSRFLIHTVDNVYPLCEYETL